MARRKIQKTDVQNRYDAAGQGRRMRGWNPATSGPNRAAEGLQKIRDRSRDAVRNDWSGESGIQKWTTNLIGVGIVPRIDRIPSGNRKREITDLWDDWVREADADGVQTFYGMQTLLVRTWLESGEVFIRQRPRRTNSGLTVPLQVQMIEPDFVPMLDAETWPGLPKGNKIRSGIEIDNRGKRIAFWMYRQHPSDYMGGVLDSSQLLRIPAEQVLHVFEVKRPGQMRGIPPLASVLARLRNINDYDDAVLERQKLANLFAMFITRGVTPDGDIDPMSGLPIDYNSSGENPLAGLQPGIVQELGFGEDVRFSNPPEAGTTYSDYMRTQHLGTAAAAGIPYEVFSGDIKEVSDRTLRVIINEYRRFAEQRQWQIIIPMFCQPVRDWWTEAAVLSGQVSIAEADSVRRVQWAPHGWAYIHPVQDPTGKKLEVDAGFRSRSSVIGERGDDPEMVDDERAKDLQRSESLGLSMDPLELARQTAEINKPEPVPEPEPVAPAPAAQDPREVLMEIRNMQMAMASMSARYESLIQNHAAEPKAQPVFNVHFPEQKGAVINVAPAEPQPAPNVQIDVHVPSQPAPIVNNEIQVQPTEVKVNNTHPRSAVQTVERDENDEIVRTVTQYEP